MYNSVLELWCLGSHRRDRKLCNIPAVFRMVTVAVLAMGAPHVLLTLTVKNSGDSAGASSTILNLAHWVKAVLEKTRVVVISS